MCVGKGLAVRGIPLRVEGGAQGLGHNALITMPSLA